MTEQETKELFCPHFTTSGLVPLKCMGRLCSQWRWAELEECEDGQHPHDIANHLKPYHHADTDRRFVHHGFCGLAGPQKPPTIHGYY